MSVQPVPLTSANTALDTSSFSPQTPSLPLWDRISQWASENKAVVYTIAGVAVVVSGAGVFYYLSDSRKTAKVEASEEVKRASKKERRRAKKEKEKEQERKDAGSESDLPTRPTEQGKLCCKRFWPFSSRFRELEKGALRRIGST